MNLEKPNKLIYNIFGDFMNQLIEILKEKNYLISRVLLFNYRKLKITDCQFVILVYLTNQNNLVYNPKQISNDLNMELNEVLDNINDLSEKGILKIELKKTNNIRSEIINLDLLYEKLAFSLNKVSIDDVEDENIFSLFETEFGRSLSPMECEIISNWVSSGYKEELIKLALKEATYNGVNNLRYIDKIIYEWNKKGIKTKEDVEKNRKNFKNNSKKQELFDYDWLNE